MRVQRHPPHLPGFLVPGPNFCDTPSLVNIGKKVEDDDAQALRQLELCLRVHAKIASGVYSSPPPGTLRSACLISWARCPRMSAL